MTRTVKYQNRVIGTIRDHANGSEGYSPSGSHLVTYQASNNTTYHRGSYVGKGNLVESFLFENAR